MTFEITTRWSTFKVETSSKHVHLKTNFYDIKNAIKEKRTNAVIETSFKSVSIFIPF